jgi:hypothetical protein
MFNHYLSAVAKGEGGFNHYLSAVAKGEGGFNHYSTTIQPLFNHY